jgi:hypothetical protein
VHPNRVLIIDPKGKVVAKNSTEGDEIVMAPVRISGDFKSSLLRERRPELYEEIAKPSQR